MSIRGNWQPVACGTPDEKEVCRAWFVNIVPLAWTGPYKVDAFETADGKLTALRAFFRTADRKLKKVIRRDTKHGFVIRLKTSNLVLEAPVGEEAVVRE